MHLVLYSHFCIIKTTRYPADSQSETYNYSTSEKGTCTVIQFFFSFFLYFKKSKPENCALTLKSLYFM